MPNPLVSWVIKLEVNLPLSPPFIDSSVTGQYYIEIIVKFIQHCNRQHIDPQLQQQIVFLEILKDKIVVAHCFLLEKKKNLFIYLIFFSYNFNFFGKFQK